MAGMFYSLQEAAQKLNMSEEEVQKLVEERKLREFRDGTNVLFKVAEVESLMADTGLAAAEPPAEEGEEIDLLEPEAVGEEDLTFEPTEPQVVEPEGSTEEELTLEPSEPQTTGEEDLTFEPIEPQEVEPEEPAEEEVTLEAAGSTAGGEGLKLDDEGTGLLGGDTGRDELSLDDSLALLSDQEDLGQPAAEDSFSLLDTDQAKKPPEEAKADNKKEDTEVSFSLDEQQKDAGLTNADTAITREGISVLDESDSEFKLADTAAETKAMQETSAMEQLEGDINLDDTLGSGSGLLDLSLQADDTSLGGILDEIYTPAGEEGAAVAPEPAAASAADVVAEADSIMAQESSMAGAPAVMVQSYVEPEPDSSSNIFGGLLLIPLLVVVYTLLVTVAGQFGVLSSLIPKGITIIYILAAVGVVGLAIAGYGYMQGAPAKPKEAKPKKEKPPKVKKEKPKKEKPVKVKKEKKKKEKKK
jgi:excisionase family DNA binding protein